MKHTKLLAVFAVLVMTLGCLTCIMAVPVNEGSNDLADQGTVKLDTSKDFKANADELEKLGITNPSCWFKDNNGTTLTLDNVNYTTKKSPAIDFVGKCSHLTIVVKGENNIVSGNISDENPYFNGIRITESIQSTTITGNGSLYIEYNKTVKYGGSALYVINDLTVSKCKLYCHGPEINQTAKEQGHYTTFGICTAYGDLVVTDGALVVAKGGDIYTNGESFDTEKRGTKSYGFYLGGDGNESTLTVKDSTVIGGGGDIEYEAAGFEARNKMDVKSIGINVPSSIILNNAILRGYGGTAIGKDPSTEVHMNVNSEGIRFGGDITAVSSEISTYGGKAVSNELAVSAGIRHYENLDETEMAKDLTINLTDCDLYAFGWISEGADKTEKGFTGGSFGLTATEVGKNGKNFDLTIVLKETIAIFSGYDDFKGKSMGVSISAIETGEQTKRYLAGSITVDSSELYINGSTKAANVLDITTKDTNYKYCYVGEEPYTWEKPASPDDLIRDDVIYGVVGYHYNLFTVTNASIYSPIISYTYEQSKVKLPNYEIGLTPEGKKFKCWSIDGKEYRPGEVVDLKDGPLTAIAVFEKDTGSDNNNTVLWICLAIAIIVIVLLLIVFFSLRKPSAAKKSEKKPVAKKKATKPKAKPKATAKKTTAKKAPAKKSTTKKTAKPRAKKK